MLTLRLYLKDYFPELGENGCNAYIDSYIPSAFKNVESALATKKYPCVLVCPGGAYSSTTDREAECVAMHFVAEGYRTQKEQQEYWHKKDPKQGQLIRGVHQSPLQSGRGP